MCGVVGVWREEGIDINDIRDLRELIKLNLKRGVVSYGLLTDKTLFKTLNSPEELIINYVYLYQFLKSKYLFIHLRTPTGDNLNNLEVTQPIIKDDKTLLFNGILNDYDKQKYKVDTLEVLDNLESLEKLKGSFALCYILRDEIYLARCINTLFYDNNFFSSVEFPSSKELKHGEILNFKTKQITKFNCYTPYNI